jgi:dienelactone hydrolase
MALVSLLALFFSPAQAALVQGAGHADLEIQAGATTRVVVLVAALSAPASAAGAVEPSIAEQAKLAWASTPLLRDASALNAAGVALASFAPQKLRPSDLQSLLTSRGYQQSLDAAASTLQQRFPGATLVLAGPGSAGDAVLAWLSADKASGSKEFSHTLLVGAHFQAWRALSLGSNTSANTSAEPNAADRRSTLIVHTPTQTCPFASHVEASENALRLQAQYVRFYYPEWDTSGSCSLAGQLGLRGRDATLRTWLLEWLAGKDVSGEYGAEGVTAAYDERLQRLEIPASFGEGFLESTVLTPAGAGPHPLLVFHHGDVGEDSPRITSRLRLVDWVIAREFLALGYAVAFPQRPGVGGSEGKYPRVFYGERADPTLKGRIHGAFSLWATGAARLAPRVDPNRVVVAGQSAGGYAVMAIASVNPPWVKALINYSGGRSSHTSGGGIVRGVRFTDGSTTARRDDSAQSDDTSMIEGFRTFGKTARTPLLMIFAANDSRYKKEIIEKAATAYAESGGSGVLKLYPDQPNDGHFVYHRVAVWQQDLREFLKAQGLPSTPLPKPDVPQ